MMFTLTDALQSGAASPAFYSPAENLTTRQLLGRVQKYRTELNRLKLAPGQIVAFEAHSDVATVVIFLALLENKNILVPLARGNPDGINQQLAIANAKWIIQPSDRGLLSVLTDYRAKDHRLIENIRDQQVPGLILFSSGSTGEPKAMLHDMHRFLSVYHWGQKKSLNTLLFMGLDHVGGIDTLFRALAAGNPLTLPPTREVNDVSRMIEMFKVKVIPASPTFLNLMLLENCFDRYDLSSLEIIAYGAEPMPKPLLARLLQKCPDVKMQQKFGTSETNAIRIRNKSGDSLYFKIDDPNVEYRIVDNILFLKSRSRVLGYLNAPEDPLTVDGWFDTGDLVEESSDGYLKIIGRARQMINVGGEKAVPEEIEAVLLSMPEIDNAMVYGEENPIMGQIVAAEIQSSSTLPSKELTRLVQAFCSRHLAPHKVPVRIRVMEKIRYSDRMKKIRP